jgi:hypothetical protein
MRWKLTLIWRKMHGKSENRLMNKCLELESLTMLKLSKERLNLLSESSK